MMKLIKYPARAEWPSLLERPSLDQLSLEKQVRKILLKVQTGGDKALRKLAGKLDGVKLKKIAVDEKEIAAATGKVPVELRQAIDIAIKNITAFHTSQIHEEKPVETMPGVTCWRKPVAIEKVGLYIPGGTAPLFSTVLMLGIPARIAGCKEIILCTPPQKDGTVNPVVLYAAQQAGISRIFRTGGAQAIAAMAYGTESIPAVNKIFGPGNQYVTCAKQLVQSEGIAIDMPAGPSEVCVLADETAVSSFVASDLLSQAEHGPDSQVMLVSTSLQMIRNVKEQLARQLDTLPRKEIATLALDNSKAILVNSMDEAIDIINEYAAEHLIIASTSDEAIAARVVNAGSVFLGNFSPESAGDYASGTNHTLPTNGYARAYSGVSIDSFVKKITYQKLTREGLRQLADPVQTMAVAEGLHAHARAIEARMLEN